MQKETVLGLLFAIFFMFQGCSKSNIEESLQENKQTEQNIDNHDGGEDIPEPQVCNGSAPPEGVFQEVPLPEKGSVPSYPGCHFDCLDIRIFCHKGIVYEQGGPVSCENWTGKCPVDEIFTCPNYECRKDCHGKLTYNDIGTGAVCEKYRLKKVGDPCKSDENCQPGTFRASKDGLSSINSYLVCKKKTCVESEPPKKEDHMKPCLTKEKKRRTSKNRFLFWLF